MMLGVMNLVYFWIVWNVFFILFRKGWVRMSVIVIVVKVVIWLIVI